MLPLRRYILNGLTVLSLLLAIATAVLWIMSLDDVPNLDVSRRYYSGGRFVMRSYYAEARRGVIDLAVETFWTEDRLRLEFSPDEFETLQRGKTVTRWSFWRSDRATKRGNFQPFYGLTFHRNDSDYTVRLHLWLPFTFFSALPLTRACRLLLRIRRHRSGHCPTCGYDMRANPSKCSECGYEPVSDT